MADWWAEVIIKPFQGLVKFQGGQPDIKITNHVVLTPGPADVHFTGSHPSLGLTLRPAPAAVSIAGGQPNVAIGQSLAPGPAAVSFTGGQPVVTNTQNKVLTPGPAAVSVAGGRPVVTVAFGEVDQVYTSGQLAAVTAAAFPAGWTTYGTGVYVKGIGAGGKGVTGQAGVNSTNYSGGAGGAGFDEVFIPIATILAAGSSFNARYGVKNSDGNATNRSSIFSVGALSLTAGGANTTTPGTCTIAGVTGVTTHNGLGPGLNSAVFAGAGGGQSNGIGGFATAAGSPGGNSPTKTGGASNAGVPTDAAILEAGAGGGGGLTDNSGASSVGQVGAHGGKFGGGGGAGGSGWAAGAAGGVGGDGGLRLRWV